MSAVEVYAVVTGSGPAVVLSNSLGSDHRMWDAQVAELEKHFTVVRYDTRGHGASPPVPTGPPTRSTISPMTWSPCWTVSTSSEPMWWACHSAG